MSKKDQLNLDILLWDPTTVILNNKEYIINDIPLKILMRLDFDNMDAKSIKNLCFDILKATNPEIEEEVVENLTMNQANAFLKYCFNQNWEIKKKSETLEAKNEGNE